MLVNVNLVVKIRLVIILLIPIIAKKQIFLLVGVESNLGNR